MKKTKKKVLFMSVIMIISTVSLTAMQTTADSGIKIDDLDYSYSGISAEKAEHIVKSMFGIQDNMLQPFSIMCLFGHSISTGGVISTQHNVYSANPRCLRTISSVEFCTRDSCSYFRVTSESSSRVGCC